MGQKYSHIETINEVYRAEIDRLRDKVNRERGQHARDKEGIRRDHENMAENIKLDHTREMDKRHQDHEAEIGKLKGMQTIRLYFYDSSSKFNNQRDPQGKGQVYWQFPKESQVPGK